MQLLGRPRPVELAVGGRDLLGIGDAVLELRHRPPIRERGVDQVGGQLGGPREHGARVVVDPDWNPLLRGNRTRVELLHQLDDADARFLVAGHQCPLDGRRPTPARQQRRVGVEPARPLQRAARHELSIRDNHERVHFGHERVP